jgi:hypothetical protein
MPCRQLCVTSTVPLVSPVLGLFLFWLAVITVCAAGCVAAVVAPLGLPAIQCEARGEHAVQRASREFACPPERIGVIKRTDISEDLYDLDACGQRARYSCPKNGHTTQCIREPDPTQWDPDPRMVASLPQPEFGTDPGLCPPGNTRRICRDRADFERNRNCIIRATPHPAR